VGLRDVLKVTRIPGALATNQSGRLHSSAEKQEMHKNCKWEIPTRNLSIEWSGKSRINFSLNELTETSLAKRYKGEQGSGRGNIS
jgi:hypothetical protein